MRYLAKKTVNTFLRNLFMDNLLEQKSERRIKGWLIAGTAAGILYIVASILFIVYFNQTVAGAYDAFSIFISVLGAYSDTFGLVAIMAFILFLGLLIKKGSTGFFVKFMSWAILLLSLYYIMPKFQYFYQVIYYGSTVDVSQTLYILCLIIPHIIFSAFMITYSYQIKSDNKKVPYVLSWISFLAAIITFANQTIFVIQQIAAGATALNVYYYAMAAISLLVVIFLSAVYHRACQKSKGEFYGV